MQLFAAVHTARRRQSRHRPGPRHVLFLPHHTQTETHSSRRRRETFLNSHPLCMKVLGPGIASRTGQINGHNQQTTQVAFPYLACPGADKRHSVTLATEMSLVAKWYWP